MFDLGFWEIAVILVIALLVVGPERLPGLARTVGIWIGKGRRFVASVKADIDRELKTEELKQLLDKQGQDMVKLRQMLDQTRSAMDLKQAGQAPRERPPAVTAQPAHEAVQPLPGTPPGPSAPEMPAPQPPHETQR